MRNFDAHPPRSSESTAVPVAASTSTGERRWAQFVLLALALLVLGGCGESGSPLGPVRGPASAPGADAVPPSGCGRLLPGESLQQEQFAVSCNGVAELILQTDQTLVMYDSAGASWNAPNTGAQGTAFVQMQGDGNLVAYDAALHPLWATGTAGHPNAWLAVQNDCNLVIYAGPFPQGGAVLWTSNTSCRAPRPAAGRMLPGDRLSRTVEVRSVAGNATLAVQGDGNVVLYGWQVPLWTAPNTVNHGTSLLMMQGDGNLVASDGNGVALWTSGTGGHPGAWLAIQDDCNLVIYAGPYPQTNGVLWASGAVCAPNRPIGDDYPRSWIIGPPCTTGGDTYNFVKSNCTSFAAWRLERDGKRISNFDGNVPSYVCSNGQPKTRWSDATCWDEAARRLGLRVDKSPEIGAIAQWNGTTGHVAYVSARFLDTGEILVEEYNYSTGCRYGRRRIPAVAVENYIHF
ncbi:CHAP domain-containing protein [Longimicrobium sp.]|uniref:CHAP domain-containing protein n=1 Tax=Longimicrobium sp. TaxID=2029185 RepID=UPI002CC4B6EB|nr:CHAP domain-containing protein [Longimicrobium sp.]HSU16576.1 CHAP domain-containing protein [Longimicrobium sp.]